MSTKVISDQSEHMVPSMRKSSAGSFTEMRLPNGSIYKGNLVDGKYDGRGILIYANKERYEGEFKNGMKHGKGKYYYIKGELYIGDWIENKKQGKGLYFYENGNRYNGDFQNNMKHGKGRIDEENGSYYLGEFFENNKDKTGEYYEAQQNKKYLQVYDKGIQISCREIIDIPNVPKPDSNGLELPELLRVPTKRVEKIREINVGRSFISDENIIHSTSNDEVDDKQFVSHFIPQSEREISLHQLYFEKSKSEDFSRGEMILSNYFDKHLIEKKSIVCLISVNEWTKDDVGDWLNQIGFGDCIDEFKENNVVGESLLRLDNTDLKELHVAALGDRKILNREIDFLKLIFKSQCIGDPISKLFHRDVNLKLVRDLEKKIMEESINEDQTNKYNENELASSSSSTGSEVIEQDFRQERAKMNMQSKIETNLGKIETYMVKKGIRLTFLIPKDQIEIIKPIGKGGYGQVYLGRWLGQDVAVKKYTKKQGFRNRHVGNFIEEVQVINKLLHPCIVLYMGMCIFDNEYIMITEFLSGGSLFDFLHKRGEKLDEQKIFYICKDVALGMSYLHGKNVLHCDLKSSNVLIDENWNVKLCDFGLSRLKDNKKNKKDNIRVGTPHWMAPEILKGEKYECESDVYSFGILLWEMLTCQIPYKELSTSDIINLVGKDENHHIAIPNYPNELFLKIFLCCTERDPKKRPTFKSIVDLLEKEEKNYESDDEIIKI